MNQALTAEDLFYEMKRMPAREQVRFFTLLAGNAFRDDDFTHEQVFGHLKQQSFSAGEAAEYLEISISTLRRYVQSGKLVPNHAIGRNQMFSAQDLRAFKRSDSTC
ncbi:MAG: helix-turn-helix domain-containing protein [Trichlorobacter sp.]|jgi:excisionase family DNA binding protein|nr:helix-turn-helix domain-containing protein [Trichlorobacter sp.]